jgi:hypothetical protein
MSRCWMFCLFCLSRLCVLHGKASPVMRGDCLLQSRGFLDVGCIQLHPVASGMPFSAPQWSPRCRYASSEACHLSARQPVVRVPARDHSSPAPLWRGLCPRSAHHSGHPSCNCTVNQLGCCSRSRATVIVHSLRFPPHCSILQYSGNPSRPPFLRSSPREPS